METTLIKEKMGKAVSELYGIPIDTIIGRSKIRFIVTIRQMLMRIYYESGMTSQEVGKLFNRDHSTILYATQHIKDLCDVEKGIAEEYENLKQKFTI